MVVYSAWHPFSRCLEDYFFVWLCQLVSIHIFSPVISITLLEMGTMCNGAIILLVSEAIFLSITLSYYHHLGRRSKKMWGRPATMLLPIWQNLVLDGWVWIALLPGPNEFTSVCVKFPFYVSTVSGLLISLDPEGLRSWLLLH